MPNILGANSVTDTGHDVANSCRFDVASTDYLNISQSNGNRKTYTWSCWFKRSTLATFQLLWHCNNAGHYSYFGFDGDDKLIYYAMDGATNQGDFKSTRVFRDVSSWYHIVARIDTTESSSGDRLRFYINGEQITSWDTSSQPMSQNTDTEMNVSGHTFRISTYNNGSSWLGGYLAECVFCDGQSLDPTSFGEFDSDSPNIWKPIDVSGLTFGTNGFHLDFENASSLGADVSGNGNNFTVYNLTRVDQSIDTCTNNFATLNPLNNFWSAVTFSQGNCETTSNNTSAYYGVSTSTIGVSSGRWYFEAKNSTDSSGQGILGITSRNQTGRSTWLGSTTQAYGYYATGGVIRSNSADTSYGQEFQQNDIIGIYLDLEDNKLYISDNGTLMNSGTGHSITPASSTDSGFYHFAVGDNSDNTQVWQVNFGGSPAFTVSSGNTDDNGYGNFEYSPNITGDGVAKKFYALCTKNLAEFG